MSQALLLKAGGRKSKMMWAVVFLVGAVVGVALGALMGYWGTQEYRKNFKRNLRELKNDHS